MEDIYARCSPYMLLESTTKLVPEESEARLSENHFHSWNQIHQETSGILYTLALGGDENASRLLVEYSRRSTELLRQLAFKNPKVLHHISEYEIQWPAFWSRKVYLQEENEEMMRKLNLGEKSKLTGKFNLKCPATQTALRMLSWLQQNRDVLGLPDLTQSTREKWFQAGWLRHLHETQSHPEAQPYLRVLVEKHAINEVRRKQDKSNLETAIARRIKAEIKRGFRSVTAKAS